MACRFCCLHRNGLWVELQAKKKGSVEKFISHFENVASAFQIEIQKYQKIPTYSGYFYGCSGVIKNIYILIFTVEKNSEC